MPQMSCGCIKEVIAVMKQLPLLFDGSDWGALLNVAFGTPPNVCWCCKEAFSTKNVFTLEGYKETKISSTCEKCFDNMFKEEET